MKIYLVQNNAGCLNYHEYFLVNAESKKNAINSIYNSYGYNFPKKDFTASNVDELFKENGLVHVIK